MEDDFNLCDPKKVPPVPLPKTILLVNNFIATTTRFLNHFSMICEDKLASVGDKIMQLEVNLTLLENKLQSVPHIHDEVDSSKPAISTPAAPQSAPAPTNQTTSSSQQSQPNNTNDPTDSNNPPPGMVRAKDHPDYASLYKLLSMVGNLDMVKAKATMSSLDPNFLDNPPDAFVPLDGSVAPPPTTSAPSSSENNSLPPDNNQSENENGGGDDPNAGLIPIKEHPTYRGFFKMLKVGLLKAQVEQKMTMSGLDPSILADPDKLVEAPPPEEEEEE